MIPWIFLGLLLSIPLFFGYSFIPSNLLAIIEPWARPLLSGELRNHYFPDVIGETYPWKVLFSQFIRQGIWPIWNPYNQFGSPFLAISTQQPFDLFNILYLFLPTRWSFDIILILKTIFSGYFMSLLLSAYGVRTAGRLLGGLCYAFSGAMVLNAPFCWMQGAFVWLPLLVLHLEKIRHSAGTRHVGWAALFLGFALLGGSIQTAIQLSFFLLLWICATHPPKKVFLALLLGFFTGAMSTFPTLELLSIDAGRIFSIYNWLGDFGNNLAKIPFAISFFLPHFFGHPTIFNTISFFEKQWSDIVQGFIGFIPFCLYVMALITLSKHPIIRQYKYISLITLSILFLSPLHEWLYLRALVLWSFSAAIMAALCIQALESDNLLLQRAFLRLKRIALWSFALFFCGVGLTQYFLIRFKEPISKFAEDIITQRTTNMAFGGLRPFYFEKIFNTAEYYTFTQPMLLISLGLLLSLYLGLRFCLGNKKRFLINIFLGLTFLDLIVFFYTYIPLVNLNKYPLYPITPAIQFLKRDPELFRVLPINQENGRENPIFFLASNAVWGIESIPQQTSLYYRTAARFQEKLLRPSAGNYFDPTLADFANVKYILTTATMLDSKRYPLVYQGEINIFLNPGAKPRAFFPTRWEFAIDEEDVFSKLGENPATDESSLIYLQGSPNLPKNFGESRNQVKINHYSPLKVILRTETEKKRLLVLTDAYYPGWKAYIDGKKTGIYRANALFRAIEVPLGIHEIHFQFEPFSFYLGLWTTIISILIAFLLIAKKEGVKNCP